MKKFLAVFVGAFLAGGVAMANPSVESLSTVNKQYKKFAPAHITYDKSSLTKKDIKALKHMVNAADIMSELFWMQVYSKNDELKPKLSKYEGKDRIIYDYFMLNFGPFDRLENNRPFVQGVGRKPLGANYYPANMTKKDFEDWIKANPNDKKSFESEFTIIRREGGKLVAIPYSVYYKDLLIKAANELKEAAKYVKNASLKKYLKSRADAFLSNDYYQSDIDWVHLKNHNFEVVFGPYEVYEDLLLGYKTAFTAFITLADPAESKRLGKVVKYLSAMEKRLPVEDEYKGIGRSLKSPIVVTDEIYTGGDTRPSIQTLAFNLPNDERVRNNFGSKKVMLRNVNQAKFDKVLVPIANILMKEEDAKNVDFDAFFANSLIHEISHGIGPGEITVDGVKTTVKKMLQETYSMIEECKADILAQYNMKFLVQKKLYSKKFERVGGPTYLAFLFRVIRHGIHEAHGGAAMLQFSYLREKGGIGYDADLGQFFIDKEKIDGAVKDLSHDLLMIEAKGDYAASKKFIDTYGKMTGEVKTALKKIESVPVDIRPIYDVP